MQRDVQGQRKRDWTVNKRNELVEEDLRFQDLSLDVTQDRVKWMRPSSKIVNSLEW